MNMTIERAMIQLASIIAKPVEWLDEDEAKERVRYKDYMTPDYDIVEAHVGEVKQRLLSNEWVSIVDGKLYVGNDMWYRHTEGTWHTLRAGEYTWGGAPEGDDEMDCPMYFELAFFMADVRMGRI